MDKKQPSSEFDYSIRATTNRERINLINEREVLKRLFFYIKNARSTNLNLAVKHIEQMKLGDRFGDLILKRNKSIFLGLCCHSKNPDGIFENSAADKFNIERFKIIRKDFQRNYSTNEFDRDEFVNWFNSLDGSLLKNNKPKKQKNKTLNTIKNSNYPKENWKNFISAGAPSLGKKK